MSKWHEVFLKDIGSYGDERINMKQLSLSNYISTENMIPDKQGVTLASSLPTTKTVQKYKPNDILISNIRPYFKKIWFADREGGCSNDVLVIRNRYPEKNDSRYLYYCLFDNNFFDYVMSGAKGAKMPRGDKEEIMKYQISLPPLNIQRQVSEVLSSIDNKIKINLKVNNTLEEMAMTLYKNWFVDFGPFQDGEFVDSELGMIPKGWEVGKLADIANILMGQSPKSEFYNQNGEGLPFHQGVKDFGIRFPIHETYCTKELRVANPGDFLVSVRAPVGRLNITDRRIIIGRGLSALSSKQGYSSFLFYTLKRLFAIEDQYGSGTVFNSITKNDLEKLPVLIPEDDLLKKYEEKVSKYDAMITKQTNETRHLEKIRDYLLPRLLSGEIDVTKAERQVEQAL